MDNKVKVLKTSTERLLAVADIVEADDGRWDQSEWSAFFAADLGSADDAEGVAKVNSRHTCGSFGCIAGWSIAMSPKKVITLDDDEESAFDEWTMAGAKALDLKLDTADWLFTGTLGQGLEDAPKRVGNVLRFLASIEPTYRQHLDWGVLSAVLYDS